MKNVIELLDYLNTIGVGIKVDGSNLVIRSSGVELSKEIKGDIRKYKQQIISLLTSDDQSKVDYSLSPIDRTGDLPLSFAQQRLWFLYQYEGSVPAYHLPTALRIKGPLDADILERVFQKLIQRHEAFRTCFKTSQGEAKQQIVEDVAFSIAFRQADETEIPDLIASHAQLPFDLETPPLLKVGLLRITPDEHVLLINMHHIISDAWSNGILIREFAELYSALSDQRPSRLPDLPIQYADYASRQRQYLQGNVLGKKTAYWKKQLEGIPPLLTLPTDRPRPVHQTFNGAIIHFNMSGELSDMLTEMCRKENVTMFMILLAGFQILLSRYSGMDDIVVGSPIANRTRPELENLVGFFVNTLVLRSQLFPEISFNEFLARVKETTLGAYDHQEVPFEALVESMDVSRSTSYSPLFQVMLNMREIDLENLRGTGLEIELMGDGNQQSQFDLTLYASTNSDGLSCAFQYNTDLFDPETIERLTIHFQMLLQQAASKPSTRVSELDILTNDEKQRMLTDWNDTAYQVPQNMLLHRLVEKQAEIHPDRTALKTREGQLTFAMLNQAADRLAHRLVACGVRPDQVVGIYLERSFDAIIAILAVLKTGGAYAAFDLIQPQARLATMAAEAGISVLITTQPHHKKLTISVPHIVYMDDPAHLSDRQVVEPVRCDARPEHLAYICFTSGSTGKPKGISVTHRSVVDYIYAYSRRVYGFGENDITLQLISLGFDPSIREIFCSLVSGAVLTLLTDDQARNPGEVLEVVSTLSVNRIPCIVPAFLRELNREIRDRRVQFRHIQTIATCGDVLLPSDYHESVENIGPHLRMINQWGPSECVMSSSYYVLESDCIDRHTIPIGRPVPNTKLHILDARLKPQPIGVYGEIYVEKSTPLTGYLNQPQLTQAYFIPAPGTEGKVWYKTGDIGRYTADGHIEYLRRADNQVKVRGVRIELDEIRTAIRHHPAVSDVVVTVQSDDHRHNRLIAYYTQHEAGPDVTESLREGLKSKLPEYMIPSVFMRLDSMPVTPNGKIDRTKLPKPDVSAQIAERYVAPSTAVEKELAAIWRHVLNLEKIGITDNFFEIGGHSLLATRVTSAIQKKFEIKLALRTLFSNSTIQGLAEHITRQTDKEALYPLHPVERTDRLPLSFAQQRLWFLHQYEGGVSAYNMSSALRLKGVLDINALKQVFDEMIRRHEVFRTSFHMVDGEAQQTIADHVPFEIDRLQSASGHPADLIAEHARTPFDLEKAPLLRVGLLPVGETEHVLLINMHHIISDAWSNAILVREFTDLYSAFAGHCPSPLAELPIQYADFAYCQRQHLQGEVLQNKIGYWKERLAGLPPLLDLPTDRPRPVYQTFNGATHKFSLSPELTDQLQGICRRENATLFMVLLAGFQILLAKYSGSNDIAVGSPVANRTRQELENLVGFFVNTLVLRSELSPEIRFNEFLAQVKETTLGAYDHQEVPFEALVEVLEVQRSTSYSPLFQVMLNMREIELENPTCSGLDLEVIEDDYQKSKFDLSLYITPVKQGGLSCAFQYNTDLFDPETIERLTIHFQMLLQQAASKPSTRVSELDILTNDEKQRMLTDWNDTAYQVPQNMLLHRLVEKQAEIHPDRTALKTREGQLTFAMLNQAADRLAHRLVACGVRPDQVVGIYLERSFDAIIAILAVLKTGGAYAAFDLIQPQARLATMAAEAGISVLITTQPHHKKLTISVPHIVYMDDPAHLSDRQVVEPVRCDARPEHLAYICFTSGSTGKPKGISVTHRSVVDYIYAYSRRVYGFGENDITLQLISLGFDPSIREIFCSLVSGAVLTLLTDDQARNPGEVLEVVSTLSVNRIPCIVPAFLRELNREIRDRRVQFRHIQTIATCGDVLLPSDYHESVENIGPHLRMINQWGPSECVMSSSYYVLESDCIDRHTIPIGRPVPNTKLHILDARLKPQPIGVYGEIYVEKSTPLTGYLNQPQLTQAYFIPAPGTEGKVWYKTGDIGRYTADGHIEYLRRADNQVKVRGVRIELDEIRTAIRHHPAVSDVVVTVQSDDHRHNRLIAYYTQHEAGPDVTESLREGLKSKLPEYMIPSVFMRLDSMPVTPNGKIDRTKLPKPDVSAQIAERYVAPSTAVEKELAAIWRHVLNLEKIGITDNFFEIGGHSLLATRVTSAIQKKFEIKLALRTLFSNSTIQGLAEHITRQTDKEALYPLHPVERTDRLPLSFAQQRLWFLHQYEGGVSAYNMSSALRLKGVLDINALKQVFDEMIRRHEVFRTSFHMVDGEAQQTIADHVPFEIDRHRVAREELIDLIAEHAHTPFDLEKAPLLRVNLLQVGETEHVLLINMHHIISDAWSNAILVREFTGLYSAFTEHRPSPLTDLPIQYVDFAYCQRRYLQGEVLQNKIGYWKARLAGLPPLLDLPTDRPRPVYQTFNGATHKLSLSPELTDQLQEICRRENVTLFMVLLAGFQILLAKYSGSQDIAVGSPVANRTRPELENLVGFFVNTLVLRSELSPEISFKEFLAQVKETTLGAYDHQDVPFETLVDVLEVQRSTSYSPLFQVMLNMRETGLENPTCSGLDLEVIEGDYQKSKFDLTLYVAPAKQGGLSCTFQYNKDLFDRDTIERLAVHFEAVMGDAVACPSKGIHELNVLREDEISKVIHQWNDTFRDFPNHEPVHRLFQKQSEKEPHKTALVFEDRELTYGDLNRKSNQAAHYLIEKGVGRNTLVGLHVKRSFDMIIWMLGILKAGGTYVPIDPTFPEIRKNYVLNDSGASLVIIDGGMKPSFLEEYGGRIVAGHSAERETHMMTNVNAALETKDADLAYVIYTSGSTGNPKGVMVSHRALSNFLFAMKDNPGIGAEDVLLAITTISFDIAALEVFLPLITGAGVIIAGEEAVKDGRILAKLIQQRHVTMMQATPATWKMMIDAGWTSSERTFKLLCGGENLGSELMDQLIKRCRLGYNLYGPTEATVWSTIKKISGSEKHNAANIGRPIANVKCYILDDRLHPVPIGAAGELHIAGEGLATGYWNNSEITKRKFVTNPFEREPSGKMYKTGDLARYLPNGDIEFLGRTDTQIKLRGFRMELGEIESVLLQSELVKDAVVSTFSDGNTEAMLIAYLVLDRESEFDEESIKDHLISSLPEYMIPSRYIPIDKIPLTPNEKVDRNSLPLPDFSAHVTESAELPETETETMIMNIWADLLGHQEIGVTRDFFSIGGNSILAVKLISKIEDCFAIQFNVREIFNYRTIRRISDYVDTLLWTNEDSNDDLIGDDMEELTI